MRVRHSCLHGHGVFAVRHIPPSTFISEYAGELLHVCPRDRTYVMCVTVDERTHDYMYIDARDPTTANFTRYLNDPGPSRRANCEFRQNDLCVEVWTRSQSIMEGEELTVKYMAWNTHIGGEQSATSTPRRSARTPAPVAISRPSRSISPPPKWPPDKKSQAKKQSPRTKRKPAAARRRGRESSLSKGPTQRQFDDVLRELAELKRTNAARVADIGSPPGSPLRSSRATKSLPRKAAPPGSPPRSTRGRSPRRSRRSPPANRSSPARRSPSHRRSHSHRRRSPSRSGSSRRGRIRAATSPVKADKRSTSRRDRRRSRSRDPHGPQRTHCQQPTPPQWQQTQQWQPQPQQWQQPPMYMQWTPQPLQQQQTPMLMQLTPPPLQQLQTPVYVQLTQAPQQQLPHVTLSWAPPDLLLTRGPLAAIMAVKFLPFGGVSSTDRKN